MMAAETVSTPPMITFRVPLMRVRSLRISTMSCLRATSDQPEGGRCSMSMLATSSPRCDRSPTCMSNRCASLIVIVNPSMGRCTAMCAGPSHGGNGAIRNGLKVFGSGELVWKTDVLGVRGEFRSGFQYFCAFSSVGRATDF